MESKFDWNLKEIFENDEELEKEINELYKYIDELKKSKGKLSQSVDEMYKCYSNFEKCIELHEKIYAYAMLKYHQDMSNQDSIKLFKRIENITADISEAESFISPEISKIPDEKLEEYLKNERMQGYEKSIRDIMKEKKHILSEEVENVLAKYYEIFTNSE